MGACSFVRWVWGHLRDMKKLVARAFNCTRGVHDRDRSKAYQDDKAWVSVCVNCGAPVRRALNRKWEEYEPQL